MKIVLIGCGLIARSHANVIREIEGITLSAVCDINEDAAKELSLEYDCAFYTDAEVMLEEIKPDAAVICVPTFLHEHYVKMCVVKKIHVLCEKPLERSVEACGKIISHVKESDIVFMTAQVVRFWTGYVEIKQMIESGELGKIYMMHLRRVSSRAGQYGKWLFDPEGGGGAMHDMLVHDVDYLRYVAGPFETCYANATTDETGCYNNVMANVIHKNGIHAVAEVSFTMQTGYPFSFSVHIVAENATVEYSYSAGATIADRSGSKSEMKVWKKDEGLTTSQVGEYDAYKAQMEYFVNCIRENKQPEIITPQESYDVIRMIDALHRSADSGELIRLD